MFCCALLRVQYLFCNHLDREERAGCLPSVSCCCVAVPRGATGLSAVCDCGIS